MTRNSTPPMRLCVGYKKGGTAKTTTSVLLALAPAAGGERVALLDTDQTNGSATMWRRVAGDAWPENLTVERFIEGGDEAAAEACTRLLETHRHLIVDTGPSDDAILADVLTVTTDLICPTVASPIEVMSMLPTLRSAAHAAQEYGVELHVLLCKVRRNSRHRVDARQEMEERQLPVMTAEVRLLDLYLLAGGTAPTDVGEYADVLAELIEERTTR